MFQQILLVGNLSSDVESRYTPSGVMVANFRMATNKSWADATTGERKEKVTWWRVNCWRQTAENVAKYLTKGQRVMVIGEEVEARPYMNKQGEAAASLEMTAQVIKFLSAKGEVTGEAHGLASAAQAVQNAPGSESDVKFMEDRADIVPF